MTTARQVAADVLNRSRVREAFVAELVEEAFAAMKLTASDRRFVTQLVFGVSRRSSTLDALLKPFIRIPRHTIQPRVWDVLRLGAFQLVFLTHIPPHAAVNETVELAAYVGAAKGKGFVNGVMRRVAELVTDEFTDKAAVDSVPVANRYRKLTQPLLPNPEADPVAYLAKAFSLPRWLAKRWLERYGTDEVTRLGFWFNAPPPLWIRVNKLRTSRASYHLQLAARLIEAEPGPHPQSLRLVEHHGVRDLPGYAEGDFTVQDHSSMPVASALGVQPGMHVLDLCAAPGGKTTHLAELMDNRGRITACDIDAKRLEMVSALCRRLGIQGVETVLLKKGAEPPAGPFDAVLVDVPCSNTGVIGRRPEVRWRLKPREFEHLVRLQTQLLILALERVKPGGPVVYSTCSMEPEENAGVVRAVCRAMRGVLLEAEHSAIPGQPSDGGYWARLRKPK